MRAAAARRAIGHGRRRGRDSCAPPRAPPRAPRRATAGSPAPRRRRPRRPRSGGRARAARSAARPAAPRRAPTTTRAPAASTAAKATCVRSSAASASSRRRRAVATGSTHGAPTKTSGSTASAAYAACAATGRRQSSSDKICGGTGRVVSIAGGARVALARGVASRTPERSRRRAAFCAAMEPRCRGRCSVAGSAVLGNDGVPRVAPLLHELAWPRRGGALQPRPRRERAVEVHLHSFSCGTFSSSFLRRRRNARRRAAVGAARDALVEIARRARALRACGRAAPPRARRRAEA